MYVLVLSKSWRIAQILLAKWPANFEAKFWNFKPWITFTEIIAGNSTANTALEPYCAIRERQFAKLSSTHVPRHFSHYSTWMNLVCKKTVLVRTMSLGKMNWCHFLLRIFSVLFQFTNQIFVPNVHAWSWNPLTKYYCYYEMLIVRKINLLDS